MRCYTTLWNINVRKQAAIWNSILWLTINHKTLYLGIWGIVAFSTKIHCKLSAESAYERILRLEMWANAQRDGHPAQYRWRLLFNAAKFGWRPILECRAVTLPRCETRWNLQGCPKLTKWSQPLVGRSSPYCGGHVEKILLLNKFFSNCRHVP